MSDDETPTDGAIPPRLPAGNLIIPDSDAGGLVRVLPKTTYTMTLVVNTSQDILLAKYVAACRWASGLLIVRLHAFTFTIASQQSFLVNVYDASYSDEDPGSDFITNPSTPLATATIDSRAPPTARLLAIPFNTTPPIGAQLRVVLSCVAGISVGAQSITLGVDLVGRLSK